MADANDDLLDGELEGDFGELDAEEEDALLADDDFMYQTESSQRSVYIEEEEEDEEVEEKSDSTHNKFYHSGTEEDVQDVAEGDEILEEEDDVLDLGVVDELDSELDEGPVQGGQQIKNWRLQEPPDKKSGSEGHKLNRQSSGFVKVEKANVSSSTSAIANNVGVESDDDDDEERRGRFKSERTSNTTIISLKNPLKKSLADIPDSLDNVVPIEQIQAYRGNARGMFRGNHRGGNNRGGFQPPLITIALDNVPPGEQMLGHQGNMRGMWRGPNRGRGGFPRLMRPPFHGMPPRPPMMGPGPYPLNQAIRPLRPPPPQQQNLNFSQGRKIHINPHFRGSPHQGPDMRSEWDEAGQHHQNQGPPYPPQQQNVQIQREGPWGHEGMVPEPQMMHQEQYYQPEQPPYQQPPMQYMHHNPEPQVFNNPQPHQPPPPQHDRLVCKGGSRITIQTNFQPQPVQNFEEFPNRPYNNGQFPGPFTNQQNVPRPAYHSQYEEQFPPRQEYQEPVPPQPQHQFHQEYQPNEWNQGPAQFNSPPPQFYGRELQPPPQQQQMFRPPGPVLRPPPPQQQQFQSPRGQFRGGIRGRLGTPDKRIMNKRTSVPNQVNNEIPFKQARFEQRKGGPVMSNLHEVKTVDNLPPEVLPDTTTEPEEEDEETKLYRMKIEEQKKLREKVMAEKEARREQAAAEKKLSMIKSDRNKKLDDGPPGVDPDPVQQTTTPVIIGPVVHAPPAPVGISQRGRGSVYSRLAGKIPEQREVDTMADEMLPMVTVTSSGIRLPTKYKRVKVRTKDGNIITKRTPVLLGGSEIINDGLTKVINTTGENNQKVQRGFVHQGLQRGVQRGNIQQGVQRVQLVDTVRGGTIPVRARGTGRGGVRGVTRGGAMAQRGRGVIPPVTFKVTTEVPKTPLTLGQRFAMQKNQQQIEASQPQSKSNRVVMPTGVVQVTAALNTVPLPNSCLLTIDNLSASTTREVILRMANQVGKVKQLKLDPKLKRAVLRFNKANSAAMFFQRFQRKMVDLSMINVTVVPE